jgi:hypothetical protein
MSGGIKIVAALVLEWYLDAGGKQSLRRCITVQRGDVGSCKDEGLHFDNLWNSSA